MEAALSEAPKKASLKPDILAGKELAQSKPRKQAEGSRNSNRRLRTPDSLEGWGEGDLNQKFKEIPPKSTC